MTSLAGRKEGVVLYAQYVAKIRHYTTKLNLNDAVECAIKEYIVEAIEKHLIQKRQAPFGYLSIRFINPAISSGSGMTHNAPFLVVITDAAALAKQSISCILCSVSPSMPYSNT